MSDAGGSPFDPYHLWLQVPKDMRPPTHYQMLGLRVGEDDTEVIRQANLMRSAFVRHFQRGEHGDAAARILEELAEANRVLLDPTLRATYLSTIKTSVPVATVVQEPARVMVVGPVAIAPPKVVVEERPVPTEPRTKKKRRRSKSRSVQTVGLSACMLVVGLGVTAYVASNAIRLSQKASVKDDVEPKENARVVHAVPMPEKTLDPPIAKVAAPPSAPERVVVRLTLDPPEVRLSLQSMEGQAIPKASIKGAGDARRIVAEQGALPLLLVATAPDYKPLRVTVVPADVSREVQVLLNRETLPDPFAAAGNLPAPWREQGEGKRYRMASDFRVILPVSSGSQAPVWRYTAERPGDDWTAWGFDDSRWPQGPAAFAAALGDEFKVRSGRKGDFVSGAWGRTMWRTPELWLRKSIDLPARIRLGQIRWNYRADDSITVYVNGREEFTERRATWRAQRITNPEHFLPGRNVIAVYAVNRAGACLVDVGFEWLALEEFR